MARGVHVPSGSVQTAFLAIHRCDEYDSPFFFDDFIEELQSVICSRYPSFSTENKWHDDEARIILSNAHADVIFCTYCGVASASLMPRSESYLYRSEEALHHAWCEHILFRDHLESSFPGFAMRYAGSASNGESFYREVPA